MLRVRTKNEFWVRVSVSFFGLLSCHQFVPRFLRVAAIAHLVPVALVVAAYLVALATR